jgi:hypothetical protein
MCCGCGSKNRQVELAATLFYGIGTGVVVVLSSNLLITRHCMWDLLRVFLLLYNCLRHFQLGFGSTSLAQIHQDTWDYCSIFWQMGFNPSPFAVLGCCTDFMDTGSWLGCSWFSLQGSGWQEGGCFARLNFKSNLAKFD